MLFPVQVALARWEDTLSKGGISAEAAALEGVTQPTFGGLSIGAFFEPRAALWPLLTASLSKSVFWPSEPDQWPTL